MFQLVDCLLSVHNTNQWCWCSCVISAFKQREGHEGYKFRIPLCYIMSSKPVFVT